jgi:hypothetical protein
MILVDAVFVNNGGGKVLLDYLVQTIEENGLDVFYLFDKRNLNDPKFTSLKHKKFINGTFYSKIKFYYSNKLFWEYATFKKNECSGVHLFSTKAFFRNSKRIRFLFKN